MLLRPVRMREGFVVARANPVDVHVGTRVRLRRTLLGMSQEKLGQAVGLTFQQVQKYERGVNRISAARLHRLSQVLDVPVLFFFDDMPPALSGAPVSNMSGMSETPVDAVEVEAMSRRETIELVRAYYRITDPLVRRRVGELVKSIAGPMPNQKRRGRPPGSGKKRPTEVPSAA
jgi:transcriptional regulator with XRE-family HTH domain